MFKKNCIYKVSGAGNHFLIVDSRHPNQRNRFKQTFGSKTRSKIARELCDPYTSIGADGLLFLENSTRADLKWLFFNADGSEAELCGNAARCVGNFVKHTGRLKKNPFKLETKVGIVEIRTFADHTVAVTMPLAKIFGFSETLGTGHGRFLYHVIDTGVPHAVVKTKLLENVDVDHRSVEKLVSFVDKIRKLKKFKREGTNVSFYYPHSHKKLSSLTFERGVPGYTQACGTGAVAVAIAHSFGKNTKFFKSKQGLLYHKSKKRNFSRQEKYEVVVPGGKLEVDLSGDCPTLRGPAKIVAKIELV